MDGERCQNNITLFITSVSLDKESAVLQCTVKGNFFTLPVVGSVVVKSLQEASCCLIIRYSVNKLFLSLVLLIGNEILEEVIDSGSDAA